MISIRRVLFPTDFSESSKAAEAYAMALADRFGADLHLLHVVAQVMPYSDASSMWVMPDNETQAQIEAAEQQLLQQVVDAKWAANHRVVRSTVVGFVVDQVLAYATKNEIDLIVVGTHGYSWLSHALIGSVAEKLVRMANCPVLTVHPTGHPRAPQPSADTSIPNADRIPSLT